MTNFEKFGFSLVRKKQIPEINADLLELEHIKSGASLVYLDRDDENKTFSIGFATPPKDDTGVFHIIEHSVLCGSEKYPLKDPFAELLKGSLNTFLNAVTYEDRTIYPVSSRCEKDFLNLVDVYMDATLSPNLLNTPSIFKQEGWRYEYDEEEKALSINGVVYNEMKGAYSSPDELGMCELNRLLYDDCHYRYDSGGNPEFITDLSYEDVLDAYNKYYHPTNARIFLDGKMDLQKILPLLDSHLGRYDRGERTVLTGKSSSQGYKTKTVKYEISENESETGKARLLYGFVCADFADKEAHLALSILSDLLCGSNASPLKKALLDKGLAKDAAMYTVKSRQLTLVIELRDADETRLAEIEETINGVILSTANDGIDKSMLKATLNSIEFRLRERDFGTLPTGIAFAMSVYGSWVYGGLPEDALINNDAIECIKEKIDTDYFEKALLEMTLNNPHRATVVMLPDSSLGERAAKEEKERLDSILHTLSERDIEKIKSESDALREWQNADESEKLSCLPGLELSDIPQSASRPALTEKSVNGVKIFTSDVKTNGIVYISLFFDACDLANEELLDLSILTAAMLNSPTETQDALSLQNDIKANLGSLYVSFSVGKKNKEARPYLKIGGSALASKSEDLIRIIGDALTSKTNDPESIKNLASQIKSHIEDAMISSGESTALSRLEASFDESGAMGEYLSGYEAYRVLSDILKDNEKINALAERSYALLKKLITKRRLLVFITGETYEDFREKLVSLFPDGEETPQKKSTLPCADRSEFIITPSKVGYAIMGGQSDAIKDNLGLMRVVRSILSYEYLWNTVRVQSGAYGTGFIPRRDGSLAFYSYRDPSPEKSMGFYRESADYLHAIADSGEDITKFVIGAFGEYDLIITPKMANIIAANDYFTDWSCEEDKALRSDMLKVTATDLHKAADIISSALADAHIAIVGSAEQLDSLSEKPEKVIRI